MFTIHDCGFIARCALEEDDASQVRIEKLYDIIADCRYGVHDLSRTGIEQPSGLPRFNMPLELGVFLGAKRFGKVEQKRKKCLILESKQYRYRAFISDISGQDITAHNNNPQEIVTIARNWLRNASRRATIPSGSIIWNHYQGFLSALPLVAQQVELEVDELVFNDYTFLVAEWLKTKENR